MPTKKKAPKKPPREDFNEAAFRIVQLATQEKPTKKKKQSTR
jgi:hypothetical protein